MPSALNPTYKLFKKYPNCISKELAQPNRYQTSSKAESWSSASMQIAREKYFGYLTARDYWSG
jgi:hypothetical protein